MKKIAVISAMADEAQSLIERFSLKETGKTPTSSPVYEGTVNGKHIIVSVCKITGKVAAAMLAEEIIMLYSPDMIVNLGIAGGVLPGIKTGDICISEGFVQYDFDLSPLGYEKGVLDDLGYSVIKSDPEISNRLLDIAKKLYTPERCFSGIVVTGDSFMSSSKTAKMLHETYNAVACEMEGAAIAFVCHLNNVPFTAVRSISDNADDGSAFDFATFRKKAIENSTEIMSVFLEN